MRTVLLIAFVGLAGLARGVVAADPPPTSITICSSAQACPTGQQCQFSSGTNGFCAVAGGYGSLCKVNSDCTGTFLNLPLICTQAGQPGQPTLSICSIDPSGVGLTGQFPGFGSSSTGPARRSCKVDGDCLSQQCIDNVCAGPFIPSMDCKIDGVYQCKEGITECLGGACIQVRPQSQCTPACRAAYGEVCNPFTASCVINQNAQPDCPGCNGRCVPSSFPGSPPICLSSDSRSCSDKNVGGNNGGDGNGGINSCGDGFICALGQCAKCGQLCGVTAHLLEGLIGLGINVSAIGDVENRGQVQARINGQGQLVAPPGTLMQLNGSFAGLQDLVFNSAGGVAQAALAQVFAGAPLIVRSIDSSSAAGSQILLDAGADFAVASLNIQQSSSLTLQLGGAPNGGRPGSRANFTSLSLNGPLNVAGDNTTFFMFPPRAQDSNSSASGSVQVSGGVNLQGNAGGIRINIAGSTASGNAFEANVAVGAVFTASGPIMGSSSTLVVSGDFRMSGRVLEAALRIGDEASAAFTTDSQSSTFAGNVSFISRGGPGSGMATGRRQYLIVDGSAAGTGGEKVFFQTISNCPEGATVRLNIRGSATVALASGITLFNYGVSTYSSVSKFFCSIEVCGSDDGCIPIVNPNVGQPVNSGRRLLSDTTSSATFGTTSLQAKSTTTGGNTGSATHAAASIFTVVFAAIVASMRL